MQQQIDLWLDVPQQCFKYLIQANPSNEFLYLTKYLELTHTTIQNSYWLQQDQSPVQQLKKEIESQSQISKRFQTGITRIYNHQWPKELSKTYCPLGSLIHLLNYSRTPGNVVLVQTKNYISTKILQSIRKLHQVGYAHLSLRPSIIRISKKINVLTYDYNDNILNNQQIFDYFLGLTQARNDIDQVSHNLQDFLNSLLYGYPLQFICTFAEREAFEQTYYPHILQRQLLTQLQMGDQEILILIKVLCEQLSTQNQQLSHIQLQTLAIEKQYQMFIDNFQNAQEIQIGGRFVFDSQRKYMAPELAEYYQNGQIVQQQIMLDMFSFGMILADICGIESQGFNYFEETSYKVRQMQESDQKQTIPNSGIPIIIQLFCTYSLRFLTI